MLQRRKENMEDRDPAGAEVSMTTSMTKWECTSFNTNR